MIRIIRLFSTSIGDKLLVAVSGAALLLFLLGHMLGNLTVFQGPDVLNGYAAWLQGHPLLWVIRLGLISIFVIHVVVTVRLTMANRAARPVRYQQTAVRNTSLTSRYMVLTGGVVLAFVAFHLAHLTFGAVLPENHALTDASQRPDVYTSVIRGFENAWISATYELAIVLLGLHLIHGAASLFQTLGINHESYTGLLRYGTYLLVAIIMMGYCSIPTLIYLGYLPGAGG